MNDLHKSRTKDLLKIVLVAIIFALGWYASLQLRQNETVVDFISQFGYTAIVVVAFIGGFNLLVPIPAISFMPVYLASGLNQYIVFFLIAIGTTAADSLAYYLGKVGRRFVSQRIEKWASHLERWRQRHYLLPLIILFLFSAFVPLPNEVLLIPMGFLRYPARIILLIVFVGNLVFNTLSGLGAVGILIFFAA